MNRRTYRDPAKEPYWRQIFRDWKASGKTRKQFCQQQNLRLSTFDYWRAEIARRDASPNRPSTSPSPQSKPLSPPPVLVPVRVVVTTPLEVQLPNGTRISVPPGFDAHHLQALLAVLEDPRC